MGKRKRIVQKPVEIATVEATPVEVVSTIVKPAEVAPKKVERFIFFNRSGGKLHIPGATPEVVGSNQSFSIAPELAYTVQELPGITKH